VCTGIAWTYLVAAEIVNLTTGLGAIVQHAQRFQDTAKVYAGILLILIIGNVTDLLLGWIRGRFFNWES
jgi:NitT/TauT family transport system permease protein